MKKIYSIQIKDLSYSFGKEGAESKVLNNIDFNVEQGEIVIVTGPSGSGKTTLLTLIGGLRKATQGSIKLLGHELVGANEKKLCDIRRGIGFIFQSYNLMPYLTVFQNVLVTLELYPHLTNKRKDVLVSDVLRSLGIYEMKDRYPKDLSGGQKQRVSIARALVAKPKIILADEPTSALDKKTGHECVELLRDLAQKNNATVLFVTHDHRILDIASRVVSIEDGRLHFGNA